MYVKDLRCDGGDDDGEDALYPQTKIVKQIDDVDLITFSDKRFRNPVSVDGCGEIEGRDLKV